MLPAFIVTGGVALFAVAMTGICYVIIRRAKRSAAKSPPSVLTHA